MSDGQMTPKQCCIKVKAMSSSEHRYCFDSVCLPGMISVPKLLTKFLVKNLCDILSFLWAVERKPGAFFDSGLDNSLGSYCPGPGWVWN